MRVGLSDLPTVLQPVMASHRSRQHSLNTLTQEICDSNKESLNRQPQVLSSALQIQDQGLTRRGGRLNIQV